MGLCLLLLGGAVVLLSSQVKQREADKLLPPTPTPVVQAEKPPQGANNLNEETFNVANGFVRSFDRTTNSTWKSAQNVQLKGVVSTWSKGAVTVSLGGGTLTLKIVDPIRFYCFPEMVAGANGDVPMKTTTLYTPLKSPATMGQVIALQEVMNRLGHGKDIYVVATREGEWLQASLIAGYGCGYPTQGENK